MARRSPTGFEPPSDPSGYITTPGGTRAVEQRDTIHGVRLDFWDDRYHYLVIVQGSQLSPLEGRDVAIALVDQSK
jgi:hypothetical protein